MNSIKLSALDELISLYKMDQDHLRVLFVERWSNTGWKTAPHERYLEIARMASGRKLMTYADEEIVQETGDILFMDCSEPCVIHSGQFSYEYVSFELVEGEMDPDSVQRLFNCFRIIREVVVPIKEQGVIAQLYVGMAREYVAKQEYANMMIKSYVLQLLLLLRRIVHKEGAGRVTDINSRDVGLVNEIISYCSDRLDQKLVLPEIAARFGKDPRYLNRLFKRLTESTIMNYVNKLRMDKAKRLLQITSMTNLDIALELGIETGQYFNYLFKKNTGLTPSQFRSLENERMKRE
jgi:AraC-like DNA-binding protein